MALEGGHSMGDVKGESMHSDVYIWAVSGLLRCMPRI